MATVKVLAQHLEMLDKSVDDLEKQIGRAHAQNEMSRLLDKVPGIGKITASVITASVPDPSVFKSGRDFAAWLGLTPKENSSGRQADARGHHQEGQPIHQETARLGGDIAAECRGQTTRRLARLDRCAAREKPARLVTVALANKLARILWAMMKTGEGFRTEMFAKV